MGENKTLGVLLLFRSPFRGRFDNLCQPLFIVSLALCPIDYVFSFFKPRQLDNLYISNLSTKGICDIQGISPAREIFIGEDDNFLFSSKGTQILLPPGALSPGVQADGGNAPLHEEIYFPFTFYENDIF